MPAAIALRIGSIFALLRSLLGWLGGAFTLYVLGRAEAESGAISGAVEGASETLQAIGRGAKKAADEGGSPWLLLALGFGLLVLLGGRR